MGPATLLCPSSTAVQLLGQASPSKNTRQREVLFSLSNGHARHFANAHWTGVFLRTPAFFFQSAAATGKFKKNSYPFTWRRVFAAAAAGEVSVEEPAVASDAVQIQQTTTTEVSTDTDVSTATEETPAAEPKSQGRRNLSRSNSSNSKAVVVSPAELVSGATFPGKVTTIQPFGAFVDLGAFTNGLVHISRLSKGYVKKVEDVVQIGQDVNVQVLDVDFKANRISLMLVEEEKEEVQQEGESGEKQPQRPPQQQGRTPRRDPSRRPGQSAAATVTKMKKGEIIIGTVKNMIRSGVFVTLPDGTDGYIPTGEVVFRSPNTNLESQFQVGQEVTVRVLRIERGRVTLTTKQEVDYDKINEDLNKDVIGGATNPFEIAFFRNELIANFLAEREKQKQKTEAEPEGAAKEEKEEGPSAEGAATEPVSGVTSEEKIEQEKADDSVEEVKDAVKEYVEEVKDVAEEDATPSKEAPIQEEPAVEEKVVASVEEAATSDEEVSPSEVSNAKELVEEGVDALTEAVAAVEEAIVEQAGAAIEEMVNLAEELSGKGNATIIEETVKGVIAAVEEKVVGNVEEESAPVEATASDSSTATAVEEVVAEEKEEKTETSAGTEKLTPVPEAGLEGEVKETQEESEHTVASNKEEITNDNAVLQTAEVVGANVQQS